MAEESELTADDNSLAALPLDTVELTDDLLDTCEVSSQDRAIFHDLYEREYANIITMLMRFRPSLPDAQEAAQEAFLVAWYLLRTGHWSTVVREPRAWIRGVALNKYRRPSGSRALPPTVPVSELPEPAPADDDPSALPALAVSVIAALSRLGEDLRAIMVLTMEGLSACEVARVLRPEHSPPSERDVQRIRDKKKEARRILRAELCGPGEG